MLIPSDVKRFAHQLPTAPGGHMPDRYRITLAGMMTEGWLLYGAWVAGGVVLALLGFWEIGLVSSGLGAAVDVLFQRRLKALWADEQRSPEAGIRQLVPIVATRFSLGVAGCVVVILTAHSAPAMAGVMMLQAWSICVAMAQFSAIPRLFLIAIVPPLTTVAISLWPYLSGPMGPALMASLILLIAILAVIGRQVGQIWQAWRLSWAENVDLIHDLKQARAAADAASTAKSIFLATMSHEVRTPLNGILGMAQIMALHSLEEHQRDKLKIIQRSGENLLVTLNAVLDLSRIESGRLELVDGRIQPSTLLQESANAFTAIATLKGIQVVTAVDASAAGAFSGDPTRLRQILDNLVGNAVKFTAVGQVVVSASVKAEKLILEVADTGPGIAESDLARIFKPFEQADGTHQRSHEGSGLGLSISQELAILMKGTLTAESALGVGSRFRLAVPAAPMEQVAEETALQSTPTKVAAFRALVVEDHATNQLVIKTLLETLGGQVELVDNGLSAVELLSEAPFDVVMMDVQMPVMDGLTATRLIRARETAEGAERACIIGVTGNAMDHQVAECIDAGMNSVVAKPIHLPALIEAINAALIDSSEPSLRRVAEHL